MYVAPLAAELEFVHYLIYFKNDVQRTIASLSLNCYCKLPTPYVPQSRESIQSAPANASRNNAIPDTRTYAHIQITSVNRQLLTIMPLACPITLNLALKAMRNHLLKTTWYNLTGTNSYEKTTHIHSTLAVRITVRENLCVVRS